MNHDHFDFSRNYVSTDPRFKALAQTIQELARFRLAMDLNSGEFLVGIHRTLERDITAVDEQVRTGDE